jgi:hypothetical protein
MSFVLRWDGHSVVWSFGAESEWFALDDAAQFPDFAAAFDAEAPPSARGYSAPFLTRLPEPGLVQIWTGLTARTAAGWSLHLRSPANLPRLPGLELFEGIVETDRWHGPLFTNVRLTKTHSAIRFHRHLPLLQAVPVPQCAYAPPKDGQVEFADRPGAALQADWAGYIDAVIPSGRGGNQRPGSYAVAARRARHGACPR